MARQERGFMMWSILVAVGVFLLALLIDSYVGVSSFVKTLPAVR